jgi:hypothetical protein
MSWITSTYIRHRGKARIVVLLGIIAITLASVASGGVLAGPDPFGP